MALNESASEGVEVVVVCDAKCAQRRKVGIRGKCVCPHNNLAATCPSLMREWHPDNTLDPKFLTRYSGKKAKWKCSKDPCGCHVWVATIADRNCGSGCPYCGGRKVCEHSSLAAISPQLAAHWDYTRNKGNPSTTSRRSRCRVWWICPTNPCGCHIWEATVDERGRGYGCIYCAKKAICIHASIVTLHPELLIEWDYNRNDMHPSVISPSSQRRIWWICKKNPEHSWRAAVFSRSINKTGCPRCIHMGYSKIQIAWLRNIEEKQHISIQHAESVGGEYHIIGIGKVDGFCRGTNTVYEFHGDYWHGNPARFPVHDINPTVGITYGELYSRTIKRDDLIRSLGFNLVVCWETPCDE